MPAIFGALRHRERGNRQIVGCVFDCSYRTHHRFKCPNRESEHERRSGGCSTSGRDRKDVTVAPVPSARLKRINECDDPVSGTKPTRIALSSAISARDAREEATRLWFQSLSPPYPPDSPPTLFAPTAAYHIPYPILTITQTIIATGCE